jgi:hypothetical protein
MHEGEPADAGLAFSYMNSMALPDAAPLESSERGCRHLKNMSALRRTVVRFLIQYHRVKLGAY